jgi:hypothetical protein
MRMLLCGALVAAALAGVGGSVSAAHADPSWRLEQPAPPVGHGTAPVPLGAIGDLQFTAPNRGVLITGGTALVPAGLYAYDGRGWHPYTTVCGSGQGRVAWAGPRELWTVSDPALPSNDRATTLCHIVDGRVAASYAVPDGGEDSYEPMTGAACTSPADCWFAGGARRSATGTHSGTFTLHFDGTHLTIVDGPAGRGASDLAAHRGTIFESLVVGRTPESDAAAIAPPPGPPQVLQHLTSAAGITADPFLPTPDLDGDVPADGTDLLSLDSDGTQLWVAGAGSASGASGRGDEPVQRTPLLARATDGAVGEITPGPLPDGSALSTTARLTQIAAIPGSDEAWASLEEYADTGSANVRARLVRVRADGTILQDARLPLSGQVLGSGWRIACGAPQDCWMATSRGWLFHWSDPAAPLPAQDTDPAMTRLITARPADGRTPQYTPDVLPIDDSGAYVAPTFDLLPAPDNGTITGQSVRIKALMAKVKSTLLKGNILRISFDLRRPARVGLVASRKGHVVAHAAPRTLKPGRRAIQIKLTRRHWPTKLRFQTRELTKARTS